MPETGKMKESGMKKTEDVEKGLWACFTRRTNEPKLTWLEQRLEEKGIPYRRNGSSSHAPILEVLATRIDEAWLELGPVDALPDDDPMFIQKKPLGCIDRLSMLLERVASSSAEESLVALYPSKGGSAEGTEEMPLPKLGLGDNEHKALNAEDQHCVEMWQLSPASYGDGCWHEDDTTEEA